AAPAAGAAGHEPSGVAERLLLNLLPTGLLVMTPALEYALVTDLADSGFSGSPGMIVLAILGVAIHLAATILAGSAIRELAASSPGSLVISGPYARIRHPMALAHILQGAGGGLILGMRLGWVAWAAAALLFVIACYREDCELAGRFPGAHAPWCRVAGALLPGIFGRTA
ncbi:MAG TPA: hypothetical protein VIV61_10850, partial [Candidatus Ozemobacteraceae bacterium]